MQPLEKMQTFNFFFHTIMNFLNFINFQIISLLFKIYYLSFKNLLIFVFLICLNFKISEILQSSNLKL